MASVSQKYEKSELSVTLIDGGSSGNCFYYSLYGAAKFYVTPSADKKTFVNKDLSVEIYEYISGQLKVTAVDKETFISAVRTYVADLIKKDPSVFVDIAGTNKKNPSLYKKLKDSFKNGTGDLFKTWLAESPAQVKLLFGHSGSSDFESEYVNANFDNDPNEERNLEQSFYNKLGGIIGTPGVYSFESDIEVVRYILGKIGITLMPSKEEPSKPTIDEMTTGNKELWVSNNGDNYNYFTVMPSNRLPKDITTISTSFTYDKNLINNRNAVSVYKDDQIVDTVDYHQLGINRYKQLLDKYKFEQELYKEQRIISADKNIEVIAREQSELVKSRHIQDIFDITVRNYNMYKLIQDKNMESLDDVVRLTKETYKMLENILTDNFKKLSEDDYINTQNLLLTFKELDAEQQQLMRKLDMQAETRAEVNKFLVSEKILRIRNSIKIAIHDFSARTQVMIGNTHRAVVNNTGMIETILTNISATEERMMGKFKEMMDKLNELNHKEDVGGRLTQHQIEFLLQLGMPPP